MLFIFLLLKAVSGKLCFVVSVFFLKKITKKKDKIMFSYLILKLYMAEIIDDKNCNI